MANHKKTYNPTTWRPLQEPKVGADLLNNIEKGVKNAVDGMNIIFDYVGGAGDALTSDSGLNFTVSVDGITELNDWLQIVVKFTADAMANATINVNSIGAYPVHINGEAIKTGDIKQNSVAVLVFNNDTWNCVAGGGNVPFGTLYCDEFTGTVPGMPDIPAKRAIADQNGDVIDETYATKTSVDSEVGNVRGEISGIKDTLMPQSEQLVFYPSTATTTEPTNCTIVTVGNIGIINLAGVSIVGNTTSTKICDLPVKSVKRVNFKLDTGQVLYINANSNVLYASTYASGSPRVFAQIIFAIE